MVWFIFLCNLLVLVQSRTFNNHSAVGYFWIERFPKIIFGCNVDWGDGMYWHCFFALVFLISESSTTDASPSRRFRVVQAGYVRYIAMSSCWDFLVHWWWATRLITFVQVHAMQEYPTFSQWHGTSFARLRNSEQRHSIHFDAETIIITWFIGAKKTRSVRCSPPTLKVNHRCLSLSLNSKLHYPSSISV